MSDVKSLRITAGQAIVVALLSAIAGIGIALIGKAAWAPAPSKQSVSANQLQEALQSEQKKTADLQIHLEELQQSSSKLTVWGEGLVVRHAVKFTACRDAVVAELAKHSFRVPDWSTNSWNTVVFGLRGNVVALVDCGTPSGISESSGLNVQQMIVFFPKGQSTAEFDAMSLELGDRAPFSGSPLGDRAPFVEPP